MNSKPWILVVFALIFTLGGIAAGWFGARQKEAPSGHGSGGEPEHASHAPPQLPPQTLKNLGVEIRGVQPGTYIRTRSVPAVVVETPWTSRPAYAPMGGVVQAIHVEPGMRVKAGQVLVTLIRDPIERAELRLTGEILKPAGETIHESVAKLLETQGEIKILEAELKRVAAFSGGDGAAEPVVLPKAKALELQYNLERARQTLASAQHELERHGYKDAQIDAVLQGGHLPGVNENNWKSILVNNGLWPASAEQLYASLPADVRSRPWAIATIGELAAGGLDSGELTEWLKAAPAAGASFLELGALLQKGHAVANLKRLYALGAFQRVMEVCAPADAEDFDVAEVLVKPGAHAEAGAALIELLNPRSLYLRTQPVGAEASDVLQAVAEGRACNAEPLIAGAGPSLKDLQLSFLGHSDAGGTVGYASLKNEVLSERQNERGMGYRTWKLRSGLKYQLQVQTQKLEKVYVLPADGIAEEGVNKVVFVQSGATFEPRRVELLHLDDETAVIAINKDTTLFPGDQVAVRGAFQLGIALKSGGEQAADHGHSH